MKINLLTLFFPPEECLSFPKNFFVHYFAYFLCVFVYACFCVSVNLCVHSCKCTTEWIWNLSIKPQFSGLLTHTLTQWGISPVLISKEPLQNKFRYLISNIAYLVFMRRGGVLQKNICGRRASSQNEGRGRIIRLLLENKQSIWALTSNSLWQKQCNLGEKLN